MPQLIIVRFKGMMLMESMIGELIGSGGTSSVHEWGNSEVIKVFKPNVPIEVIKNEEYIGSILKNSSLCIPKYIRTIELNNRIALIYERANGKTLAEIMFQTTDQYDMAANFAKMHFEVHRCHIDELPSQHDMLKRRILRMRSFLGEDTEKMLDLLDSLPIENKLCHGDFHPLNILMDCDKYTILDWNGSCSGNPLSDVAWSYLTLKSPVIEQMYGQLISNMVAEFSNEYLNHYCQYANVDKNNILKCLPIVAIRRLDDNITCETDASKYENDWLKTIIFSS